MNYFPDNLIKVVMKGDPKLHDVLKLSNEEKEIRSLKVIHNIGENNHSRLLTIIAIDYFVNNYSSNKIGEIINFSQDNVNKLINEIIRIVRGSKFKNILIANDNNNNNGVPQFVKELTLDKLLTFHIVTINPITHRAVKALLSRFGPVQIEKIFNTSPRELMLTYRFGIQSFKMIIRLMNYFGLDYISHHNMISYDENYVLKGGLFYG